MHLISMLAAAALLTAPILPQNQAIAFQNGSVDTHVEVPWVPGLVPVRGLTVEAWISYDDSTIPVGQGFRWPTVARQDVTPQGESWFLRVGASSTNTLNLEWAVRNTNNVLQFCVYTFTPGQLASFNHVAGTWDGQQSVLYLNGVPVATTPVSGTIRDNQGVLRIGNGDTSVAGYEVWNGTIDELRIWPFARTQAEIQATMNDALQSVPGGVTFNFEGRFVDSSSGFLGTPTGNVPFVPGVQGLTSAPLGGFVHGAASAACAQRPGASLGSRTSGGNGAFEFVAYDGPASRAGALFFAGRSAATPLDVLGVDVWLDLGTLLPSGFGTTTAANGTARIPAPLPPGVAGVQFACQWVFLDPTCGFQGLTASHALLVGLQ